MTRREFTFVEGKSSKFWAVSVTDETMTVQFGKIGTIGQTQTKTFPSPAAALSAAEKLIGEKTAKGYAESAPAPPTVPAKPMEATIAPTMPVEDGMERRLNLAPEDLLRARDPEGTPAPLPAPRPFDLEACKQLAIAHPVTPPFDPDLPVTPPEAGFWLRVYGQMVAHEDIGRERAIKRITDRQFAVPPTLAQVKRASADMHCWPCNLPTIRLQRWTLAPDDLVEAFACNPIFNYEVAQVGQTAWWLAAQVFPRLDETSMEAVRERLRSLWRGKIDETTLAAVTLARHAGMETDLAAWAEGIKKGGFPSSLIGSGWASALFGIKDAGLLVKEFRRLGLRLTSAEDARTWLALTGHAGLDILRDSVLGMRRAADQLTMLDVLLLAESPEAAVSLLEVKLQAKPPEAGVRIDAWMKKHPAHAAAGLAPLAAENTPRGEAARVLLGAGGSTPTGGGFTQLLATVTPPRALPPFASPALLPAVPGIEDVARLLGAIKDSTLVGPHPLVSALRKEGDRPALAAFAWTLFEGWLGAGAPPKEKWALLALGYFGDDAVVLKLAPLIRAWPGESQHQRAVTGLEILRTIGSDAALMALNGMAMKLKFKALQDRARGLMDLIATDRGLTRDQLSDRIVPDLGLDAGGGCVFDFGPRRFLFALTPDLAPAVSSEEGKPLKDLPKPGAKDDPDRAAMAVEAWKLLKKQLRETLKIQLVRLEDAMVTGRGWTPEEFDSLLVRHPLMGHLTRRLLWSAHEESGSLLRLFRVDETGGRLSHDRQPVSLEGVATVRIAHRLRMTLPQLGSWQGEFDALDIVPPFPQLEREGFVVESHEATQTRFVRPTSRVPDIRFRSMLEDRGWRRLMHDQGGITGFSRAYQSANVTAIVVLTNYILIGNMDGGDVGVDEVFFTPGADMRYGSCMGEDYRHQRRVPLGEVDAVAYSETVRDLMSLAPPGKG